MMVVKNQYNIYVYNTFSAEIIPQQNQGWLIYEPFPESQAGSALLQVLTAWVRAKASRGKNSTGKQEQQKSHS